MEKIKKWVAEHRTECSIGSCIIVLCGISLADMYFAYKMGQVACYEQILEALQLITKDGKFYFRPDGSKSVTVEKCLEDALFILEQSKK